MSQSHHQQLWERPGRAMVNRLEDWSAGQDRALTAMGYNLCQLRLQRATEGKAPGEARGLLTDCFLDGGGVASLTGGLVRHPAGGLYLSVTGQETVSMNYGDSYQTQIGSTRGDKVQFTPTGAGCWTGIRVKLKTGTSGYTCRIIITGEGEDREIENIPTSGEQTVSLSPAIQVYPGQTYTVTLRGALDGHAFGYGSAQGRIGFQMICTPIQGTSGAMAAASRDPGTPWREAAAWIRHSAGTVAAALNGQPMEQTARRTALNLSGESCLESAFCLEAPGDGTAAVQLTASGDADLWVYDYGVVLL